MLEKETYSTRFSRKQLPLSLKSRFVLFCLRWLLRPLMAFILRGRPARVAKAQLSIGARFPKPGALADCDYSFWSKGGVCVPGHTLGKPFSASGAPVLLWLHGGAFVFPTMPEGHLSFARRLCDAIGADAFVPDYRLAPSNPFPAGLDDCENAYRLLLASGVDSSRIVIGGESAGGNLLVALLFRIREANLPMPACALPISPVLDLGRLHGAASRSLNAGSDAMLPLGALSRARDWYVGQADSANPEVSPLMGEMHGLPPMLVFASEAELLCDDSVLLARKASAAGVEVELALWPHMPHAFPLLEEWIPEAVEAREQIAAYARLQLDKRTSLKG